MCPAFCPPTRPAAAAVDVTVRPVPRFNGAPLTLTTRRCTAVRRTACRPNLGHSLRRRVDNSPLPSASTAYRSRPAARNSDRRRWNTPAPLPRLPLLRLRDPVASCLSCLSPLHGDIDGAQRRLWNTFYLLLAKHLTRMAWSSPGSSFKPRRIRFGIEQACSAGVVPVYHAWTPSLVAP
jgi:hypothetical protein